MYKLFSISTLLFWLPLVVQGQAGSFSTPFEQMAFEQGNELALLLASDSDADLETLKEVTQHLDGIVTKLERKRPRMQEADLVAAAFQITHRRLLKWYDQSTSFASMFITGKYDCVTGTAVYALLLSRLGISFEIHEFEHHLFLIAHTSSGDMLIESTDPLGGLVTDAEEIARRIAHHATPQQKPGVYRSATFIPQKGIAVKQLAGLLYLNHSIRAFNSYDLPQARTAIQKAAMLYPSERVLEMKTLFFQPVLVASQ